MYLLPWEQMIELFLDTTLYFLWRVLSIAYCFKYCYWQNFIMRLSRNRGFRDENQNLGSRITFLSFSHWSIYIMHDPRTRKLICNVMRRHINWKSFHILQFRGTQTIHPSITPEIITHSTGFSDSDAC